jgi:hypothetical protein
MTQIASAIIGGATAARAPVCCAIVVRTSPSLSPLTTLAPHSVGGNQEGAGTQDGHDGHIAC